MVDSLPRYVPRAAEDEKPGARSRRLTRTLIMLGVYGAMISAISASSDTLPSWPDTSEARARAKLLIETLSARLLASPTATAALEAWCADHKLAIAAKIRARVVRGIDKPPAPEQRARLGIGPSEPVKYRRVELVCGEQVLSEADNWYVPARLTPEMNHIVETTDTPFGRAVEDLHPFRETFAVTLLFDPDASTGPSAPSPDRPGEALELPRRLLEHRALVFDGTHRPFAEVHETYRREVLGFAAR